MSLIFFDVLSKFYKCGTTGYFFYTLASMYCIAIWAIYFTIRMFMGEKTQREKLDVELENGEINWEPKTIIFFSTSSSLAGIIAGMFGIGGSLINQLLLLQVARISPEVCAATSSTMLLFTAAAACSVYISYRVLQMGLGALMICVGYMFTWFGQNGVGWLVKKLRRPSLIVLSMHIVITAGLIPLMIKSLFILNHLIQNQYDRANMWKLDKICL
jgi:uncharacterized membrane protein YfcA